MTQTSQETIRNKKVKSKKYFSTLSTFSNIFSIFQGLRLGCPLAGSLARSALESIFSEERLIVLGSKLFGCFPGVPRHQESTTDVPRQEFDAPYNLEPRRGSCARQLFRPLGRICKLSNFDHFRMDSFKISLKPIPSAESVA